MGARVTLQTIADELGVSRTTVSNAYNRPNELSPALRARVLATAGRLGYRGPDPVGRMLRTGRIGTLGLVFTDDLAYVFTDPDTMGFVRGVAETTTAAGTGLSVLPVPSGVDPATTPLATAPVDGYLVFSVPAVHPAIELVLGSGVPVVVVDEPDLAGRAGFVGIDDRAGARAATEHVLSLGHRRVAVVAHRMTPNPIPGPFTVDDVADATVRVGRERVDECVRVLGRAGLTPVSLWEAGANDQHAGQVAAAQVLSSHPEVTAIVCTTDQVAIGALRAAAAAGRRVPDDVPEAAVCDPPLTTIRQPIVDKGRAAAGLLIDQVSSGARARVELPIELVRRASTGPPHDAGR